MSKGKLITSVLAGAAAGAILGILLAPDKGSETRKKIAKKSNDFTGSVKDGLGKIGDTIADKYSNIKGDAKDLMEKGREKGAELKENYKAEKAF
jgi:gas vesicle protein